MRIGNWQVWEGFSGSDHQPVITTIMEEEFGGEGPPTFIG